MDKKAFLIQVLSKLENDWLPAGGLKVLVEQGEMTDQVMVSLIEVIKSSVAGVESEATAEKLKKSVDLLEQIHAKENVSKQEDAEDIASLEQQLADL